MFRALCAALALLSATAQAQTQPAVIQGTVINATGGEPLGVVRIALLGTAFGTVTADDGRFRFERVEAGSYVLEASAVGYHPVRESFILAAGETRAFEIALTSTTIAITDSATVTATAANGETRSAAGFTLEGHDIANLGSVLADDPLRAVKSLPGVSANNDFSSDFSVRGAPFSRVGLYFDGVLLHSPFHTTDGAAGNGSLSIFSGDLTDEVTLYQGAWPVRYGDRTAGVVDVSTRAGTRERTRGQVSAGATSIEGLAEGPLGRAGRGAWIVAARKSYLQYILDRIDFGDQPPFAFGFADVQGRADYDVTPADAINVGVLDGTSSVDRSRFLDRLSPTTVAESHFHSTVINTGWRHLHPKMLVSTQGAFARERGVVGNRDSLALSSTHYSEATLRSDATLPLHLHHTLEFGGQLRRLASRGISTAVLYAPALVTEPDAFSGAAWQGGAYVMDRVEHGRVRLAVGLRHDRHTRSPATVTSPYASVSVTPRAGTRLQLDWGRYGQFPDLTVLRSRFGGESLRPERAQHLELLLERHLDPRTRLMVEVYERRDRDLLARPLLDPRLSESATVIGAQRDASWANTQRGFARGVSLTLQRQSANGFSGWASYAYGHTHVRDDVLAQSFPSDYDQRHTANAFVSRRLSPTINMSGQISIGSGMPLPGFFGRADDGYVLAAARNRLRAPVYQRIDARVNKALVRERFDATLFVEVINLTNRTNRDFDSPGPYDPTTAATSPNFFTMFPILPSAGIVIRFGRAASPGL